ncbi:hypothetical protein D1AOALGA4SA_9994 [Olavius algarvensis Delta 1 endosymbiont]|nr:hypothetical protein D1AOALGA4SA_9994 [Olavius algarvensis Delta 1 endosymbiont]
MFNDAPAIKFRNQFPGTIHNAYGFRSDTSSPMQNDVLY